MPGRISKVIFNYCTRLLALLIAVCFLALGIASPARAEDQRNLVIKGKYRPWLFFVNSYVCYNGSRKFSEGDLQKIAMNLKTISEDLEAQGTKFVLLISPEKEQIYGADYLPDSYIASPNVQTCTSQLLAYMQQVAPEVKIIYPKDVLIAAKDQIPNVASLYFEGDTHWNTAGGYVAERNMLRQLAELLGAPEDSASAGAAVEMGTVAEGEANAEVVNAVAIPAQEAASAEAGAVTLAEETVSVVAESPELSIGPGAYVNQSNPVGSPDAVMTGPGIKENAGTTEIAENTTGNETTETEASENAETGAAEGTETVTEAGSTENSSVSTSDGTSNNRLPAYRVYNKSFHAPGNKRNGDLKLFGGLGNEWLSTIYSAQETARFTDVEVLIDPKTYDVVRRRGKSTSDMPLQASVYLAGDSFREELYPFMAEDISNVTVVNRYYFNSDALIAEKPDIFVYQLCERYLGDLDRIPGINTAPLKAIR